MVNDKLIQNIMDYILTEYDFDKDVSQIEEAEDYTKWLVDFALDEDSKSEMDNILAESEEYKDYDDLCESVYENVLDEEDASEFEEFVKDLIESFTDYCNARVDNGENITDVLEACKKDLSEFNIQHMSASERNASRKYYKKNRRHIKKQRRMHELKTHGRVNKARSRLAKKVAAKRRIVDSEVEADVLCIEFPFDGDFEEVQSVADECGVDEVDFDEDTVFACGEQSALECLLEKLGVSGSVDDFVIDMEDCDGECDDEDCECNEDEDIDEAHHLSSKERRMAKLWRRKRQKAHKGEFSNKARRIQKMKDEGKIRVDRKRSKMARKAAKYRKTYESVCIPEEMISKIVEAAQLRAEAISENVEAQFENTSLFNSLNESESKEIKDVVANTITEVLNKSFEKIALDAVSEAEDIVNEEVIPEIVDIFTNEYTKEIVESLNENVESYLDYVAEELSNDLLEKKLVVQSQKTSQLEEFAESVISLISDKLQIIPEQEDALLIANEKIDELKERIEEGSIERKKLMNRLNESKKKAYVLENIPSNLAESQKEKLLAYVDDVLCEASSYNEFTRGFDRAVSELSSLKSSKVVNTVEEIINEEVKEEKVEPKRSSLFDSVLNLG